MTVQTQRRASQRKRTASRCGLATLAVGIGLGIGTLGGQAAAWADTGHTGSSSTSSSQSQASGPRKAADGRSIHRGSGLATARRSTIRPDSTPSQRNSTRPASASVVTIPIAPTPGTEASAKSTRAVATTARKTTTSTALAVPTVTSPTTPAPPAPLSPIAKLIALPGHIVNTVLQSLDMTAAVGGPQSPLDFAPFDDLIFAVFRRIEHAVGLDAPPTTQPVPPTMTYTGPTTGLTPTVAQFLNAAAAEYVLGGVPGGLRPFTVNGVPVTSTNILSGERAQVWVTPQNQIIIAYQGTTGGTNLLFNPLIAISQIITDLQILYTHSTPQAFDDALAFAQRVQADAALQGYSTSDIFVTGHSLGGWEAEYVAQQMGLDGIGFESPGLNTIVAGNGADSGFVNIETYGDPAAYFATDLPGLQPFMPSYVPAGGSKPHYGAIVMIGDPNAVAPLFNASALYGYGPIGDLIFMIDTLGNFFEHHLPGMQAYNLDVDPDPTVVPWLGLPMGPVETGYGELTIPQLLQAASDAGQLIAP
ncbi:hypothetical protein ORI20_25145 [Mycobacterium sp. CVI_P3]|uniref:Lipase n=1 Tax=Mycobacterium pinniadriaticum TaxID=2994102 RepID=A0ABT3SK76_9MYCO|nr:hypothetical protein [Mycobacterium pinniadriaticum]MCX2933565.1 hypothetical protein [Mycobacterium pinniadriaticum]MCX2939934.1 hypothetical protein [Mycobacterium pinniadriaticum]